MRDFIKILFLLASCSISLGEDAYHYSSFDGPVSGSAEEITVPRTIGRQNPYAAYRPNDYTFDYIARPDYRFSFGVNDPTTGNSQKHEESRDGDVVRGEYSLVEPDGTIRRVVYTADPENGFQATVLRTPAPSTVAPPALPLPDPLSELANLPQNLPPNHIPPSPAADPATYPSPDPSSYQSPDHASYPSPDSAPYPSPNPSYQSPDSAPYPSPNPSYHSPDPAPYPAQDPAPYPSPDSAPYPSPNPSYHSPDQASYQSPNPPTYQTEPDASYPTAEDSPAYPTAPDSSYPTAPDTSSFPASGPPSESPSYPTYDAEEYEQ